MRAHWVSLLVGLVLLPLLAPALDVFVVHGAFIADAPWAIAVWGGFMLWW
ncbi:hypothetical protein [Saccharothrix australiensis]|uniref:Uncharacterized protein n=1 Tax=Saccharothrix australiensis TaxID=2072 RepID=A0A495VXU6_9PSEU|nr:hypothetical protein [Saccharothrix australiensis]RKT53205.1 hypothetical protein C8E97_1763 [Saccharothrix australiensis]